MSRTRRFAPEVYVALRARRHSNREIARLLDVDEASVRRGLKKAGELRNERARALRRARQRRWVEEHREERRAYQRAALLTDKGRARTRRFRLNEMVARRETQIQQLEELMQ